MGSGMFQGCTALTSVNIPDSVTHIAENMFRQSGITSITIPEGVTVINYGAFYGCSDLASVTFEDNDDTWKAVYYGDKGEYTVEDPTANATLLKTSTYRFEKVV